MRVDLPHRVMGQHTYESKTAFFPSKIDKEMGIIRGVAMMTVGPAIGHTYKSDDGKVYEVFIDQTTLEQIKACAETYKGGVKVKADHKSGIFAVTGYLRDFRIEADVLRADLYVLSTDENRDKLLEMAATIPDTFGLSVFTVGPYEVKNGIALDRCVEILSCDLVTEPAANPAGLFERKVDEQAKVKSTMTAEQEAKLNACHETIQAWGKRFDTLEAGFTDHASKFKALQAAVGLLPSCESMEAIRKDAKSLEAKFDELKKERDTLIKDVAKEFAGVVGKSASAKVAGDGDKKEDVKTDNAAVISNFEAVLQKHYAAIKSKPKAMSAAIAEDGKGYEAWKETGKAPLYVKAA